MSHARWLWISGQVTATPTTGLLVYSSSLAKAVADTGIDITMIGIGDGPVVRPPINVQHVPGTLRAGPASVASKLPNLSYACATPAMRESVKELLANGPWDAVVIDHLQTAWVADLVPRAQRPIVFITHNHEGSMRRHVAAQQTPWSPKGLLLRFDAWKAAKLERRAITRADVVTSITEADQQRFMADAPAANHVLVKPGWSEQPPESVRPMAERPRRIGIIGSFEWHVKQDNLLRFVREAGSQLEAANIGLAIGGRMPGAFAQRLTEASSAVDYRGWVDSAEDFLADCRLGIVAEPLGGGFKLKALDYLAMRVPIAAITGSLPYLPLVPGVSMIEAEDESKLATAIVAAIDDPAGLENMAESAYLACGPTLRWQEQVDLLTEAVSST